VRRSCNLVHALPNIVNLKNLKNNHGGARPNAGMPKGHKTRKTIAKEEAREIARQLITRELEPLIMAQIENAKGISHFFLRDPDTKQFKRITDADEIERAIEAGEEHYRIYTKDPNVHAFTDLMNRALDKPAQQVNVTGSDVGPIVLKWEDTIEERLNAARERLAQLKTEQQAATESKGR
jgi:hypothetical protein